MVKFKKAQFTSHLFRNILKSKLNSYENVGYFYREEVSYKELLINIEIF